LLLRHYHRFGLAAPAGIARAAATILHALSRLLGAEAAAHAYEKVLDAAHLLRRKCCGV